MNSFFLKNLMPKSDKVDTQQQRSDFQRLIQLCNSYGLNQQQTKQLIQQFKKGQYRSGRNSVNQSMLSQGQSQGQSCGMDQYAQQQQSMMSQHQGKNQYVRQQSMLSQHSSQEEGKFRKDSQMAFRNHQQRQQMQKQQLLLGQQVGVRHQQRNLNQQQEHCQDPNPNRYHGYHNDNDNQYQEQSYNQMTFNEQNDKSNYDSSNNQMMSSNRLKFMVSLENQKNNIKRTGNSAAYCQELQGMGQKHMLRQKGQQSVKDLNQQILVQHGRHYSLQGNSSDRQLKKPSPSSSNRQPSNQLKHANHSENNLHQSHKDKHPQQHNASQNSVKSNESQPKQSQSQKGLNNSISNSNYQQEQQEQSKHELNHLYVQQIISKFQLLERENQEVQQRNARLQKQNEDLKAQCQTFKTICHQKQSQQTIFGQEIKKLNCLLMSEREKSQMLLNMKHKDNQIITGLKDSLVELTQLFKQKQTQTTQLQNKLLNIYERRERQSQQGNSQEFNNTDGSSSSSCYGRSCSRKTLGSQSTGGQRQSNAQMQKMRQSNAQMQKMRQNQRERSIRPNYGRKQLSELNMLNSINIPSQNSKQLAGQPSRPKITPNPSASTSQCQNKAPITNKENIFTPLQVAQTNKKINRLNDNTTNSEEQRIQANRRRPGGSRVDIKKYKGIIQELRNSYGGMMN